MKKSIKQEVLIRVALIFLVVITTVIMTVSGMKNIQCKYKTSIRNQCIGINCGKGSL